MAGHTNPHAYRGTAPGLIVGGHNIARHLGISHRTLYRWIKKHDLPVGRVPGGCVATTPAMIAAWVLNQHPLEAAHLDDTSGTGEAPENHQSDPIGFP